MLVFAKMENLMFTVPAVYAMMDTLEMPVNWISMNAHHLSRLVTAALFARTLLEASTARAHPRARETAMLAAVAPVKREERALAQTIPPSHVPVHPDSMEQHVEIF